MSNAIQEALKNCTSIPDTEDSTKICEFFANFIKSYGIFLKNGNTLSFRYLVTYSNNGYQVYLFPIVTTSFNSATVKSAFIHTPFSGELLANFLSNNGAKVTFDDKESADDEIYDHYLVEFTVD